MRTRGFCGQICALMAVAAAAAFLGLAAFQFPTEARAARSSYSFDGGTSGERATVRRALAASAFHWEVVPGHVTIHILRRGGCGATKGQIWLSAKMLARGQASWGVVQHEYAHQVDFFLLDESVRKKLDELLGGKTWWPGLSKLRHDQYGAERFASTLAWAYWPSWHNALIRYARAEATAMAPARFRRLMTELLARRS
ncbi:MAG: hypothetical protein WBB76_11915 [Gaiellaceae bacterium]